MAVTGDTQLGPTKQEIISELAQRALISQSKLLASVRDVSMFARKGADQISFPKNTTLFSVENRASATAATIQDVDFSKDTLLLDQRAIIAWLVDSDDEIESTLDVQRELVERAARQHAEDVDQKIKAEMELAAFETTTAGAVPTQAIVLEMREKLLRNKANPNNLWMAVSPEGESALLAVDPFISADRYGSAIIPQGVLGTLYGVKIIMSPVLDADEYFMYESDGLAVGFQRRPAFDSDKRPEYGVGAELQVLSQKYGVKALQIDVPGATNAAGGALSSESALIIKDNNA